MESIGVVGISVHGTRRRGSRALHDRRAPTATAGCRELAAALGATELVYLATCNRVEVILPERAERGRAPPGRSPAPRSSPRSSVARRSRRRPSGSSAPGRARHAVEHLFLVAAGLDSAQLGEREIQGQIRDALAAAREAGTGGGAARPPASRRRCAPPAQVHLRTQLGARARLARRDRLRAAARARAPHTLAGGARRRDADDPALRRDPAPRRRAVRAGQSHARARRGAAAELVRPLAAERAGCLALDEFRLRPPRVEAVLTATGARRWRCSTARRSSGWRRTPRARSRRWSSTSRCRPTSIRRPPARRRCRASAWTRSTAPRRRAARGAPRRRPRPRARSWTRRVRGLRRRLAERALAPVIARINRRYRETALEGVERLLAKQGVVLDGADARGGRALGRDPRPPLRPPADARAARSRRRARHVGGARASSPPATATRSPSSAPRSSSSTSRRESLADGAERRRRLPAAPDRSRGLVRARAAGPPRRRQLAGARLPGGRRHAALRAQRRRRRDRGRRRPALPRLRRLLGTARSSATPTPRWSPRSSAAARRGTTYGAPCTAEVELAETIVAAYPGLEQVRCVSSGTEAVMSAIRLARGATGRDLIVKFSGCYHGHADPLLVAAGSGLATFGRAVVGRRARRRSPGSPACCRSTTRRR